MYRRGNCKGNCMIPHRDCLCQIDKEIVVIDNSTQKNDDDKK